MTTGTQDRPASAPGTADRTPTGDGTRRRPARRMRPAVLISLIAGVLLFALSACALYLSGLLSSAKEASESGDQRSAVTSGQRFERLSPFERHKGPFAVGTAEAFDRNYDRARPALERALELTPVKDECAVRLNLAYVHEKEAEAFRDADDVESANTSFETARTLLTEAPEECRPEGGGQDQAMDEAEERVGTAQDEMNNPGGGDGDEEGSGQDGDAGGEDGSGEENGGEDGSDGETGGTGEDGPGGEGEEGDSGGGPAGETDGETGGDPRREELRERQQESQQRQDESNERRDSGGYSDKPW